MDRPLIHFSEGLDYEIGVGFIKAGQILEPDEWKVEIKRAWDDLKYVPPPDASMTKHAVRMRRLRRERREAKHLAQPKNINE